MTLLHDAWVVGRHEFHSILNSLLPSLGAVLTYALLLVLFGIVVPIGLVSGWMNAAAYLFLWFWLAWLITAGPISDSFAGERERHTLDTLFTTRLPCYAILAGKILAVTLYGLALAVVALTVSAGIALLTSAGWPQLAVDPAFPKAAVILTPLVVLLASTSGALISLSARTARQAHQATIVIVPAVMLVGLTLVKLFELIAPLAYHDLSNRVLLHLSQPMSLPVIVILVSLLTASIYTLASTRLKRLRVVPA